MSSLEWVHAAQACTKHIVALQRIAGIKRSQAETRLRGKLRRVKLYQPENPRFHLDIHKDVQLDFEYVGLSAISNCSADSYKYRLLGDANFSGVGKLR